MKPLSLTLIAALSLADVLSTNAALALPGVIELNPAMALLQHALGSFWWLPKLMALPFGLWCLASSPRRWPAPTVAAAYALVVEIGRAHV